LGLTTVQLDIFLGCAKVLGRDSDDQSWNDARSDFKTCSLVFY